MTVEDLSTRDIEMIRTADVNASRAQNGTLPLRHRKLKDPPKPGTIQDKYSAVLGDPFHAIKRPKSSTTHHEYKKAYNVALQNAFFIWNETKMKQLEDLMRKDGMTEENIESERYYNAALFKGCVDRFMPSPKHLYWRVRSVFAMYGYLKDRRGKTLFNEDSWASANNILKEILLGYYSDPPGIQLYTKRLNPDKSAKKNKYGMDMIECFRGTNRVEAYHKKLNVTFGG